MPPYAEASGGKVDGCSFFANVTEKSACERINEEEER